MPFGKIYVHNSSILVLQFCRILYSICQWLLQKEELSNYRFLPNGEFMQNDLVILSNKFCIYIATVVSGCEIVVSKRRVIKCISNFVSGVSEKVAQSIDL